MSLIALLPLAVFGVAAWRIGANALYGQATDRLIADLTYQQTQIESWLDSLIGRLNTLSAADPTFPDQLAGQATQDAAVQLLKPQLNGAISSDGFGELILFGQDNRLLASTNKSRRSLLEHPCAVRTICIFGPFTDDETDPGGQRIWLGVQYPILDSQSVLAGALVGLVEARRLDAFLPAYPGGQLSYLLAPDHSVLWLTGFGTLPNNHIAFPALDQLVGISAPQEFSGASSSRAEGVATFIPLLNAWLIDERPIDIVEQPLTFIRPLTLALAAITLAVILLASRMLTTRLARSQAGLRGQIADRDTTLAELRAADQMRNQSIAHMSHELRTSLSATLNFSGFLLDGLFGSLAEEQIEPTRQIHDSARHLLEMINDLLDIAKTEAGQMQLMVAAFDPVPIFDQALATLRALTLSKPVTIQTDLPRVWPIIRGDRRRVLQILLNLVSNAARFTDEGVITIRVHVYPTRLEVRVEDSGAGIDLADVPILFEPFRQGHNAVLLDKGGTGLGLPLSRIFARMHSGDVTYEPGAHGGSTFILSLPLDVPPVKE
ncbi:MAG: sensor histidine kinase [Aggregatilineales bacterium]